MRTNSLSPLLVTLAAAIVLAAFVAGCDKTPKTDVDAQARTAGEKIDHAAGVARDKLAEAAKKTEVAVNEGSERLKPKLEQAGAELKPKLENAGEKLKEAAQKTGEQISTAASEAQVSDGGITAAIKAKLVAEPSLSALKIDVDTQGGVVHLNGVVKDEPARQRAEQIASATKGVKSVSNRLTVKG